jgi:uncharacterized protein (DUF433 family)
MTKDTHSHPKSQNLRNARPSGYRAPDARVSAMNTHIGRITVDPNVMGGRPCIRGQRITVGTIVGLIAAGRTQDEILALYPYLEPEDIRAALEYAAWRVEEVERPFTTRSA